MGIIHKFFLFESISEYSGDYNQLVYLRARYYAPTMGRFFTKDTWGEDANNPLLFNRWNYVVGNPINITDPTGKCPAECLNAPDFYKCLSDWHEEMGDVADSNVTYAMSILKNVFDAQKYI